MSEQVVRLTMGEVPATQISLNNNPKDNEQRPNNINASSNYYV